MSNLGNALNNIKTIIQNITTTLQKPSITSENKQLLNTLLTSAQQSYIQFAEVLANTQKNMTTMSSEYGELETTVNDANAIIEEISENYENALQKINIEKSTKIKQIQFNNYFSQMHSYNVSIMKVLVFSSVLLMIDIFLFKKEIIPSTIYTFIAMIIIIITVIILSVMIYSEYQRSSYNFNVFDL